MMMTIGFRPIAQLRRIDLNFNRIRQGQIDLRSA
jgi:hypothetical protein